MGLSCAKESIHVDSAGSLALTLCLLRFVLCLSFCFRTNTMREEGGSSANKYFGLFFVRH